jgi:hypothetical protein
MKYPVLILIFLLAATVAFAQTESARISGRVTDGPERRGDRRCRMQNHQHRDQLLHPPLVPTRTGSTSYPTCVPPLRLTIQKEGFRTVVQPSLQLYVQDAVNENFTLAIGPIKQLKEAQMAREHLSGMLINAQEAERSRPLVEWI